MEEVGVLSYLWLSPLKEMKWCYTRIAYCITPGFYPLLEMKS